MTETTNNEERRRAQRFEVKWAVTVNGTDLAGRSFVNQGRLRNLSSVGAFFFLTGGVRPDTRVELRIKLPMKRNNWMKYSGEIVRLEPNNGEAGLGVRFDTAVPVFGER